MRAINEVSLQRVPYVLAKLEQALDRTAAEHSKRVSYFKENPFDTRLRSHKIHKLSARYGRTIYSVEIEADLRAVFYVEGDMIVTVDIGSHSIYRR